MKRSRKADEPKGLSIYCPCGAQWHGRYAVDNAVIPEHAKRCGPPIHEAVFVARGHVSRKPKSWSLP